jgi:hypothetical protein
MGFGPPSSPFHPAFSGFIAFRGFVGSMTFFIVDFHPDRALCRGSSGEPDFDSRARVPWV